MNAFRLILVAMAVAMAAAPAAAQDNNSQSAPPTETVGPRELENFSLEGRVTRPAEQAVQPATEPVRPPASQPTTEPAAPRETVRDASPATRPAQTQPTDRGGDLLSRPPTRPQPRAEAPSQASDVPSLPRPALEVDTPPEQGSSPLIWIAALLIAGGAAAVYWFLRHSGGRRAFAGGYRAGHPASPLDSLKPSPRPEPLARAATPSPHGSAAMPAPATLRPKPDAPVSSAPPAASPPPKPVGIVASSLRPWIDVELTPDRALVDDNSAAIAFNVTLVNSGSAPARDVSIEACLLNAGARQDVELSDFYQRPTSSSDSIPMIAPMARVPLRTAVKLPREMIHEYEVEGRKLFMPMVAVSTRYRWSSGEGQTGASFLVGKGQDQQDRLAPLRIDQGSRSWQGLGARRYEKGLRR